LPKGLGLRPTQQQTKWDQGVKQKQTRKDKGLLLLTTIEIINSFAMVANTGNKLNSKRSVIRLTCLQSISVSTTKTSHLQFARQHISHMLMNHINKNILFTNNVQRCPRLFILTYAQQRHA